MATYEKVSDLTAATALDGTEVLHVVQGSASTKATPAQINTYVQANLPSGITGATAVQPFFFDPGSELNYDATFTDGMVTAVTVTELPATTKAICWSILIADTTTLVRLQWRASAASAINYFGAQYADQGANQISGVVWMNSDGNQITIAQLSADTTRQFRVIGYAT